MPPSSTTRRCCTGSTPATATPPACRRSDGPRSAPNRTSLQVDLGSVSYAPSSRQEPTMKLGIHYMNFTLPGGPEAIGPTLGATAKAAEASGVSRFTLMDHWFQMEHFATA